MKYVAFIQGSAVSWELRNEKGLLTDVSEQGRWRVAFAVANLLGRVCYMYSRGNLQDGDDLHGRCQQPASLTSCLQGEVVKGISVYKARVD